MLEIENRACDWAWEPAPGAVSGSDWAPSGPGNGRPSRRAAGDAWETLTGWLIAQSPANPSPTITVGSDTRRRTHRQSESTIIDGQVDTPFPAFGFRDRRDFAPGLLMAAAA